MGSGLGRGGPFPSLETVRIFVVQEEWLREQVQDLKNRIHHRGTQRRQD